MRTTFLWRMSLSVFIAVLAIGAPLQAYATEVLQSPVLISEVQTGSAASAFDEYIELAATGVDTLDLNGWKLMYTSSATVLPSAGCQLAVFSTVLVPGSYVFVASSEYVAPPDVVVTSRYEHAPCTTNSMLSPSKGILSVLDAVGTVRDQFSYGSVTGTADVAALALPSSSARIFERLYQPDTAQFIDTNNSSTDFQVISLGTPGVVPQLPAPVEENPPVSDPVTEDPAPNPVDLPVDTQPPTDTTQGQPPTDNSTLQPTTESSANTDTTAPKPTVYAPIYLNELSIDPISPQSDSNDEYVELYNPTDQTVSLAGYVVSTGTNFNYRYTLPADSSIAPKGFIVLTSGDTPLALANNGGAAQIAAPDGAVIDSVTYETAKPGQTWARDGTGVWVWTTTPTPASENTISVIPPAVAIAAAKVAVAKKAAKVSVAKAATSKGASVKPKTTKPKTAVKAAAASQFDTPAITAAPTPVPGWLLALIAVSALLYGAYEYRFDVANKIWKFREYRAARSNHRH